MKRIMHWLPRVLGITYAVFLSLFAFDVFNEGYGMAEAILALLIHLVPTYFVVACLLVAWWRSRLGGILFLALNLTYGMIFTRGELTGLLIIAAPLALIGLLFFWAGSMNRKARVSI